MAEAIKAAELRISRHLAAIDHERTLIRRIRENIYAKCEHEWKRELVRNEPPQLVCTKCGLPKVY